MLTNLFHQDQQSQALPSFCMLIMILLMIARQLLQLQALYFCITILGRRRGKDDFSLCKFFLPPSLPPSLLHFPSFLLPPSYLPTFLLFFHQGRQFLPEIIPINFPFYLVVPVCFICLCLPSCKGVWGCDYLLGGGSLPTRKKVMEAVMWLFLHYFFVLFATGTHFQFTPSGSHKSIKKWVGFRLGGISLKFQLSQTDWE